MSVDPEALTASLRRLVARADELGEDHDLLTGLHEVAVACVDLFGVTGSGIMLVDELSEIRYVTASDGQGRLLEKVEAQVMEGPCTDSFVHDRVSTVTDVRTEDRWPRFREALRDEPELRAVLGVPVKLGAIPVGTLDVFLDEPHEWTEAEQDALARYASVVATTLTSALAAHKAGEQAAQLQYALDYRVVIERGVGYLMARDGVDDLTAFNRLRTAARSTRTKIGHVAQQLLDTGELPRQE